MFLGPANKSKLLATWRNIGYLIAVFCKKADHVLGLFDPHSFHPMMKFNEQLLGINVVTKKIL